MVFYLKYFIFVLVMATCILSFLPVPASRNPKSRFSRLFFLLQRCFFLQRWANFSPIPNSHPELRLYFKKLDRWQEDIFFRDKSVNFIVRYRLGKMQVAMGTYGETATESLCIFLKSRNFKADEPAQIRIDVLWYKCFPLRRRIGFSRHTLATRKY